MNLVYISDIPLADVWRFMRDTPLGAVALGGGLCPLGDTPFSGGQIKN